MIIRNRPNTNFTVLRNAVLERTDLSLKAKGLWAFLMTKPDGWTTNIHGLAHSLSDGETAIRSALKELEKVGLYRKIRRNSEADGTLQWEDYVFDYPYVGNPHVDNPTQVNTNIVNTDLYLGLDKSKPRQLPVDASVTELSMDEGQSTKPLPSKQLFYRLVETLRFTSSVVFTEGRRRKLASRLHQFSEEELVRAAAAIADDGFMQGENDTGRRYGTIDYLLRSDEVVDKWLNSQRASSRKPLTEYLDF